jgi:hypothetical protein
MKKHLPSLIYLLGMVPLGYWQSAVRAWLGDWLALGAVVVYLLLLRFLGTVCVRFWEYKNARDIRNHNLAVDAKKQRGGV